MKKKIIIASAIVLFAVATVFNMNLLQSNNAGDISLESIAVMAHAQREDNEWISKYWALLSVTNPDAFKALVWLADEVYGLSDALNLTGRPVTKDRQYPDGSWTTDIIDQCDGQPTRCV